MTSASSRREQTLIHKLRNREITGSFTNNFISPNNKAKFLFGSIPSRLRFHLDSVIEDMGNHILMGMTQCGQFILTYTVTMDHAQANNRFIYGLSCFNYQLHWWRFKIGAPAVHVAEVFLFDNQDIHDVLTIGIAQWPSVSDKILVYGQNFTSPQDTDASEFRKIYITVTAMPSLNNCKDCVNVKQLLLENVTDNHATIVQSRCLRHGLTVHTMFMVFPPFPPINLSISVKNENRFIINTGSGLHVLFIDLEENECYNYPSFNERYRSTVDTISNEKFNHRLGATLLSTGFDYKVPGINYSNENSSESMLLNKKRMISRSKCTFKSCIQNLDCDQTDNTKCECDDNHMKRCSKRQKASTVSSLLMQTANKIYDFAESDESCNLIFKWYRRRTIADKMYEFCSEDEEDTENIHPLSFHFGAARSLGIFRSSNSLYKDFSSTHKQCDMDLDDGDRMSEVSQTSDRSDFTGEYLSVSSPAGLLGFDSSNLLSTDKCKLLENDSASSSTPNKTNCSKIINGQSLLNVTCDSIWLDWETTSLSPRSDISYTNSTLGDCSEMKSDSARTILENLSATGWDSYSPKCVSPMAVKCYPNAEDRGIKTVLKMRNYHHANPFAKRNSAIPPNVIKSRKELVKDRYLVRDVSVRFERRYIELDEEILSTITEIDDEDGASGFHYPLPLFVYGTGYTQMQIVSSNKVEKLNVPCCVVRQDSLDIEQFSYKIADIICKCQGYRFWFCNDYDVEIVDVCALNGDIMAIVYMRINAEPLKPNCSQDQMQSKEPRRFFETKCLFIWNAGMKTCRLEAYSPLVEDPPFPSVRVDSSVRKNWNPARIEAAKLKSLKLGFFGIPLSRPIRYFEHLVLDNIRFSPSLEVIEDEYNMISFYCERDETVISGDDSSDDLTISNYDSEQALSEDEDIGR